MPTTIAHVDMDAFFVAVERLHDPSLVGKPVVVGGHAGKGVVAAASYEARRFGVHSAMPMARALKLCPQAVVVSRDHAKYSETSEKAMRVLEKYAPAVEPVSIDEAYLDLTGTERLLGPPLAVAHEIRQALETTLQLSASIGIGQSRVSAKIASGLAKPAGILWVLPGQDSKFLAPLAVSHMPGIGPKAEARLRSLGVRTLGDLAAFPLESLRRRFGAIAQELQERARGVDSTPVRAATAGEEESPKSIGRETTFEEDTADRDFLRAIVGHLGEDVGERLRREALLASTVTVKIRFADFETHTHGRTLPEPTDLNQEIVSAALDLLEEFLEAHPRGMGLRLLGVTVSNLSPPTSQLALFAGRRARLRQLDKGVDRLRERYGFDKLLRGRTLSLRKRPEA